MERIDGNLIAETILKRLENLPRPQKALALISFESSDAFSSFARRFLKVAWRLDLAIRIRYKAETKTTAELVEDLNRFGDDYAVGGLVIQLPIPARFDKRTILASVPLEKDVDALNPATSGIDAPAVLAVDKILRVSHPDREDEDWVGCRACIVGAGTLIGRPLYHYFESRGMSVVMLNSKSSLAEISGADLVVAGTGKPGLIRPAMLKTGADLIDFGYPGDVDENDGHLDRIGWYAPAKGGTGPILVACMFENFYRLCGSLRKN